ncbi:MAG: beta-hydroxylase [Gammaproteobacteria bacterium]|nr:beta-hydroxylase [Gammaproteobacteria bacterium]
MCAPARLHLGFLDLNGSSGRKFGSIGLAIDSHQTVIEAQLADRLRFNGIAPIATQQKVSQLVSQFYSSIGQHIPENRCGIKITFKQLIPEHSGLGSGTQLALSVGTALAKLHNISCTTPQIAAALGRGARSGIGITTFDQGRFVVDAGLGEQSLVPALIAHYTFPEQWRIVLIMDPQHQGVHGAQENNAFKALPTFPITHSHTICHLTLMKLLPAVVEQNIQCFGEAVSAIQQLIGDHFAPAQGGRYTSNLVASLLDYSQKLGHSGIAQSSWGPTGCVFVENEDSAQNLVTALQQYAKDQFDTDHKITFCIAKANPNGANIDMIT